MISSFYLITLKLEKHARVNLVKYFSLTYLLFWILLAITGICMMLEIPVVSDIMTNVSAWAPTFALLILFRKLYPNMTFKEFLSSQFKGKIKPLHLIVSLTLQIAIVVISIFSYSIIGNTTDASIQIKPILVIIPIFFITLTSGPLGEELGWRSYAQQTLQKKFNPLKSSIIVGLVWGFWHLPLWFLSGYTGLDLVYYILAFLGGIVGTSIIITFFYNKSKNILIAVWIHFWFNYLLTILDVETDIFLQLFYFIAILYVVVAVVLVIIKKSEFLEIKVQENSTNME